MILQVIGFWENKQPVRVAMVGITLESHAQSWSCHKTHSGGRDQPSCAKDLEMGHGSGQNDSPKLDAFSRG